MLYMGASGRGLDDRDRDRGRAPLSVKLAVYVESLSPERRFREAKEEKFVGEAFEVDVGELVLPFLRGMSLLGEGVTV
jgi:hypothetical protein